MTRSRSPDDRRRDNRRVDDRRDDSSRRDDRRDDSRSHHHSRKEESSSSRNERDDYSKSNDRNERRRSRSRSPDRRSRTNDKGKDRDSERSTRRSRSRSRSNSRERHRSSKRRSSRSRSRSRSRSGSSDSSDSEEDHRSSRKKKSSSSRDKLDSKGRTKEERRERRQEKKDKKEKKARKKKGLATVEWGKYGILVDSDIYTKNEEFRSWLIEEKMINPETLSKPKLKDIFREYMENYNTSTLPHDKYYDLEKWEKKMSLIRNGETVTNDDTYDFNKDMLAVQNSHKRVVVETATYLDKSKLESLRKLQNERVEMEKMKQMGLQIKDSMGIRTETKDEKGMR